ncbi:MAG TPA: DUF898 family protein [Erysipelothrix sp.]
MKKLRFDGDLWSYFSMELVNLIILFFTIGIGMPWVLVRRYRWESRHTLLEGKKFAFEGEAIELLGRWIIWWILTIITFGIYSAVVRVKILEWRINHTVYLDY